MKQILFERAGKRSVPRLDAVHYKFKAKLKSLKLRSNNIGLKLGGGYAKKAHKATKRQAMKSLNQFLKGIKTQMNG